MSTPNDAYAFDPSQAGPREHPWQAYVEDLAADGSLNRNSLLRAAAMVRAPWDAHMPASYGYFPWRGTDQLRHERVLLDAASRFPDVAAQLSAYEARLGQHTLSPDTSAALQALRSGAQPAGPTQAGLGPSEGDVRNAAQQIRAIHMMSAAKQAALELSVMKNVSFSGTHARAWEGTQHLRRPGDDPKWGTPPTKAQKKEGFRFLVTHMGQELRGALALIEPPDGGEVGRRQIAEFDKMAEKLLKKRKNGGRDAVEFYREHAKNPPPRLPPPGEKPGPPLSTSPKTGPGAQVQAATTALGLGVQPSGREGAAPRSPGSPRTFGITHQPDSRTTGISSSRG